MSNIFSGVRIRYADGSHVYAGDIYECSKCGNQVVWAPYNPYHETDLTKRSTDIDMFNNERDNNETKN